MGIYAARITYVTSDNVHHEAHKGEFHTVCDATEWLSGKLGQIMLHWGNIDPNGMTVTAEVFSTDDVFSDLYELRCGM